MGNYLGKVKSWVLEFILNQAPNLFLNSMEKVQRLDGSGGILSVQRTPASFAGKNALKIKSNPTCERLKGERIDFANPSGKSIRVPFTTMTS